MKIQLLKYITGIIIFFTPFFTSAQGNQITNQIQGTFTIYVKTMKESKTDLTENQLQEIDSLRKDSEDFMTLIGDKNVLIMSREKMEADFKWPEYSLLN